MGIRLQVSGSQINFNTEEFGIIRGYEFAYSVPDSKYAKGHKDNRELIVKGSIARTLTMDRQNSKAADIKAVDIKTAGTDAASNKTINSDIYDPTADADTENIGILEQIRKWAKIEYKDKDTYYHYVKITHTHKDEIIRYIIFPDAFVKDYKEEIDPHTGDGTYTLTLMQKADKRINIEIGPFNEVHKSLSTVMDKARQKREERKAERADMMGAVLPATLPVGREDTLNSPYWIRQNFLVSDRVQIAANARVALRVRSEINAPVLTNVLGGSTGTTLSAQQARRIGGVLWYEIIYGRHKGWMSLGNGVTQNTQLSRRIVVMQNLEDALNTVAEVRGNTLAPHNAPQNRLDAAGFRQRTNRGGINGVRLRSSGAGLRDNAVVTIDADNRQPTGGWVRILSWREGAPELLITRGMMQSYSWNVSLTDQYMYALNDTLRRYNITDWRSIRLFMATCAHESAKGRDYLEVRENFTGLSYSRHNRGAGYIQITGRDIVAPNTLDNQQNFLRSIGDSFDEHEIAAYIALNYPWEAAGWTWGQAGSNLRSNLVHAGDRTLNDFVVRHGDAIHIYLLTQFAVNGWGGSNDPRPSHASAQLILDGASWEVDGVRIRIVGDGRPANSLYWAPTGWSNEANEYNRVNTYYDAMRIFRQ